MELNIKLSVKSIREAVERANLMPEGEIGEKFNFYFPTQEELNFEYIPSRADEILSMFSLKLTDIKVDACGKDTYYYRKALKRTLGFKWNGTTKCWYKKYPYSDVVDLLDLRYFDVNEDDDIKFYFSCEIERAYEIYRLQPYNKPFSFQEILEVEEIDKYDIPIQQLFTYFGKNSLLELKELGHKSHLTFNDYDKQFFIKELKRRNAIIKDIKMFLGDGNIKGDNIWRII